MFRKSLAALALCALLAPAVHAQTVDEILAKYYAALGGLDKLKSIQTMKMTGKTAMGPGMEAPLTLERKRPGKQRVEFTLSGLTGIQAFDGEKGWAVMPFMGKKDPEPASDEDNKRQKDDADFDGPLVDWKAKGHTVELVGKESVEGADCWHLKITKKNGDVEHDYLDTETALLVKQTGTAKMRGSDVEFESSFGDYKPVDGVMLAFSMTQGIKDSPQKRTTTFEKIELNVPIDDALFAMPATAASDSTKAASGAKPGEAKTDDAKKPASGKGH